MRGKLDKWGNSFAVRIPKTLVDDLRIALGAPLEFSTERGRIVISPRKRPVYDPDQLIAGITKKNRHGELWPRGRRGKEMI